VSAEEKKEENEEVDKDDSNFYSSDSEDQSKQDEKEEVTTKTSLCNRNKMFSSAPYKQLIDQKSILFNSYWYAFFIFLFF
jgi:hypothetical protein